MSDRASDDSRELYNNDTPDPESVRKYQEFVDPETEAAVGLNRVQMLRKQLEAV